MNALLRIAGLDARAGAGALPVVAVVNGWIALDARPLRRCGSGLALDRRALAAAHAAVQASSTASIAQRLRATRVAVCARRASSRCDLDDAQAAVAQLPWVERAEVRKRWPDVLEVRIVEHRPFARWGTRPAAVRARPAVPGRRARGAGRPAAARRPGRARRRRGRALQRIARAVRARRHRRARADAGSRAAAGRWCCPTAPRSIVGSSEARLRLARFARLLPQLLSQKQLPLARADLRYTNGFALSWAAGTAPRPAAPQSQGNT